MTRQAILGIIIDLEARANIARLAGNWGDRASFMFQAEQMRERLAGAL